jgi:hypothetical protein
MLASVFHDHSAKKGSTHECSATSETQETNISVWVCHFGQLKRARLLSYSTLIGKKKKPCAVYVISSSSL